MKTEEIFKQIYQDLKEEMVKNSNEIFLKEYEIPSINYSKNEHTEDMYFASGIEMELDRIIEQFGYKIYFSSYQDKYFFSNNEDKVKERMLQEIGNDNNNIDYLKQKLEKKMDNEYEDLVTELKQSTPEKILDRAYELVVKDEIRGQIKNMNLDESELKALIKEPDLLSECYEDWKSADSQLGEIVSYTIIDTIEIIEENYHKEVSKNTRESR